MVFFGMNVIEVKGMEIRIELLGLMTTLIGPTNSGKTVFAKKLCNKIDNSDVFIDGKKITEYDIKYLRENIAVVLDDDNYENEFVYEELLYYQDQLGINFKEAELKIKDIASFFKIEHLLGKKIYSLYICDKVLVKKSSYFLRSKNCFNIKFISIEERTLVPFRYPLVLFSFSLILKFDSFSSIIYILLFKQSQIGRASCRERV